MNTLSTAALVCSNVRRPRIQVPVNQMRFAGTIDSEETWQGWLGGDRYIVVQMAAMCSRTASKSYARQMDPFYWLARLEQGLYDDPDNYPIVWLVVDGKRQWRDRQVEEARRARNIAWGLPADEYPMPDFDEEEVEA